MTLADVLDAISKIEATVVGDLMLDEYIDGSATRISPEAPVMVVRQKGRRAVPGGAANVARNAAALGAICHIAGLIGDDEAGEMLRQSLDQFDGCVPHLVKDSTRVTTRKTRVLAGRGHQVLRIDHEQTHPVADQAERELVGVVAELGARSKALIFSDYEKGVLTTRVIQSASCPFRSVNAKPATAARYQGLSMLSLNRVEMEGLVGFDPIDLEGAVKAAEQAREMTHVGCVLATMGDQGLAAAWDGGTCTVRAPRVEVSDVAGAGDTVIAAASLGAAAVGFQEAVFRLAVEASARVVRHSGVVAISEAEKAEIRALE